ncbi:MAG TPA: monofunctional biosynthetic peptidoglycan transglycosylase [Acidimicrobiales bacterium]|nr:MAG: monofunctional biosynthetic peptidoglycan transglycosylase [Acidobacteriota bacterium]HMC41700.1 monofunctional biosynthetic peptidoglycan transglycosylase [Acidimicrobiales bacterium]
MRRVFLGFLVLALVSAGWVVGGLPSRAQVQALVQGDPGLTAVMRQREEEARRARRPARRVQAWVPISEVSRNLIHAVLAAEDQKFFGHEGVDWDAIKKSVEVDRARGRLVRGGSTITQQLAKNLFLSTRRSIVRKLRELVVAWWLEADLSKKRILELYLNVIEWGDGLYGCEAAARRYYGKPSSALDPEEAAGLAGMIPNPRRINPLVDPRRFSRAQRRVLWLMAHAGYIRGDLAGLGREPPPPEPAAEEEEEPPEPIAVPEPTRAPPTTPSPQPSPPATPATPGVG